MPPPSSWTFRPARDHGLSPVERLRSTGREPGLGGLILAACWRGTVWAYLRVVHRLRVEGRENLPPPPFVMVANHGSHLDALTLAAALPRAMSGRAFALAAGDTFFTNPARAAFAAYAINALPVWRSRTSAQNLKDLRAKLGDDGAILLLFPEGTRTRTGAMGAFKPGLAALVAGTAIPVVPCFLRGAFEAWPATRRLPRPGRLRLLIGRPLVFEAAGPGRAGLAEVTRRAEAAVRALGGAAGG